MQVTKKVEAKRAVLSVGAFGTQFLPATKASPKEMLAVGDKLLTQYAVDDACAARIREMIFVTAFHRRGAVEDHVDTAYELEAELAASGKDGLMALVSAIQSDDMRTCVDLGEAHPELGAEFSEWLKTWQLAAQQGDA